MATDDMIRVRSLRVVVPLMVMAAFALKTSGQRLNFVLHIMHEHESAEVSLQSSVTQNK